MKIAATLVLVALLPLAAAAGYVAHRDPAPATMLASIGDHLKQDGKPDAQWVYLITSGPFKGETSDALTALSVPARVLEGYGKGVFVVQTCTFYSTSGRKQALLDRQIVVYCTKRKVTRAQAAKYAKSLVGPTPKS